MNINLLSNIIPIIISSILIKTLASTPALVIPDLPKLNLKSKSDLKKSLVHFEKLAKENKSEAGVYLDLAKVYFDKARRDEDFPYFDKALSALETYKKNGGHAEKTLLLSAQIGLARHDFQNTVTTTTNYVTKKVRGDLYKTPRDFQTDTIYEAIYIRAFANLAMGNYEVALKDADVLVTDLPSQKTYTLRALIQQQVGKLNEALIDFQKAISIEDINELDLSIKTRLQLARFLIELGRYSEAGEILKSVIAYDRRNALAWLELGEIELRNKNLDQSEINLKKAIAIKPDPAFLLKLAQVRKAQSKTKSVNSLLNDAEKKVRWELANGGYGHELELASILYEKGNAKSLSEVITLGLKEKERRKTADVYYLLAKTYQTIGNKAETEKYANDLASRFPHKPEHKEFLKSVSFAY